LVVASPATVKPNCYDASTRGSRIAFKIITDTFSAWHTSLCPLVDGSATASPPSRRHEPCGVTNTSHLGECKVCLIFYHSTTGGVQTRR
jgi:hypothetical protein